MYAPASILKLRRDCLLLDVQAVDLMEKLLEFNPNKRITVEQALEHPYMEGLHDPADEPICKVAFDDSFEGKVKTREQIQDAMLEEVR